MPRFAAASQPFAALLSRQAALDAVALHVQVNHKVQFFLILTADDSHLVGASDGVGIVAQHAALVGDEGVDVCHGRFTFRHPPGNIDPGNAAPRIVVEKADLV